ncbi:molybdopterin-binding protein [Alicyclobacillus fastidiosus]|uniref:Molybdopterin molybdenumtransferase n=1 Tax=Alicyclobacillus fastidiosus TaxID=392011 RepID=A0ABY6ZD64_9BACL|nr:molybdopterin-binding protein [Alicyclobacillus fastidiosus]WAH40690.1 molybdopterin-binding protein [Alicyclobacillus fastidiosus]GMA62160.1 molybdopterin-binding protein [Alicyclobacillus fastidiosus]
MRRREVPVEEAVGLTLAHDLTRIVPGEFKGRAFRKGHVVQESDIPMLLDMGKRHLFVLELEGNELHEDDAAVMMADALAGSLVIQTLVHEGKVILKARHRGMLWVDVRRVMAIIDVLPYKPQKVVLITTGSEIKGGRIEDKSGSVLRQKFQRYGFELHQQVFADDDLDDIAIAIVQACNDEATIVCVIGGMSVDPDDRTPGAIRKAATNVVTYGTPMLPGSMLMLAYRNQTAIFGLPGAVIYDKKTSFDVLLPRVLAGVAVTKKDIAPLGIGGWLND